MLRLFPAFRLRQAGAAIIALALSAAPAMAVSLQDATLKSPITRHPFAVRVLAETKDATQLADLGADLDGCRHTSMASEYEFSVVVDPTCFFAALSAEWDPRDGRFLYQKEITDDLRTWVQKELGPDHAIAVANAYASAMRLARANGQAPPDRAGFLIPQNHIQIDQRYKLALKCYDARRARSSLIAKVALQGAWALRAYLNIALGNPNLDGGRQEVDDKVKRHVTNGETFRLDKWLPIYRKIFNDGRGMTDEASFVAGITLLGFELRDGNRAAVDGIISAMTERFKDGEAVLGLRMLTKERKEKVGKYLEFLDIAIGNFRVAIAEEQINRSSLPTTMLAVAESLRRVGQGASAAAWYDALARLPETQPKMRADIRSQGRAAGADAPFLIQVGWIADEQVLKLHDAGIKPLPGIDQVLLTALVSEGLGSAAYVNPHWKPVTGASADACGSVIGRIGDAITGFGFRLGDWPETLGELWDRDFIDRNSVNRFRCPASGELYRYGVPTMPFDQAPKDLVLVSTSSAIDTPTGKRFAACLLDRRVVWSVKPVEPGKPYAGP